MEKLVFHKKKHIPREKGDAIVRLAMDPYRRVMEISEQTGHSIVRVVSDLVSFALEHTEVRDAD